MSNYLDQSIVDMRAIIATTCPEVVATGIWENEQAEMVPWDVLQVPYAVIVVNSLTESQEYSADSPCFEASVEVYYVAEVHGDSSGLRPKMELLRQAFLASGAMSASAQVISVKDMSWSNNLAPNALLISKDYVQRAARIVVDILVGDSVP